MTRTLSAAIEAELQESRIRPHVLVHFAFDSGAIRFWSGVGDLSWSGDTYTGAGSLGSVTAFGETTGLNAVGIKFGLSGIPSSLVSIALGEHYQGRACTMWMAFFDEAGVLIADPVQVFSGRIDVMVITDAGETADIALSAENRLVDFERPLEVRFYTDQDQQREFPGDKGFEFVPMMQQAMIVWGREKLEPAKVSDVPSVSAGSGEVTADTGFAGDFAGAPNLDPTGNDLNDATGVPDMKGGLGG
jgi:hypothetical protein